jgi:hypothetical protein
VSWGIGAGNPASDGADPFVAPNGRNAFARRAASRIMGELVAGPVRL